jgi:hypothetical protein
LKSREIRWGLKIIQKAPFKNRNARVILSRRLSISPGLGLNLLRRIEGDFAAHTEGGRNFTPDEPTKPTRQYQPLFQINLPAGVERAESPGQLPGEQVDRKAGPVGLPGFYFL